MAISYPALAAGLSNQKIALIGLIYKALRDNRPLILPQFMAYHPHHGQHTTCAFNQIYQTAELETVLNAFGIPYVPSTAAPEPEPEPEMVDGWQCFWEGADKWGEAGRAGQAAWPGLCAQIIRFLRPTPLVGELAEMLYAKLLARGIHHALQLRIEQDWQGYSAEVLPSFAPQTEDYNLPFMEIVQKAKTTWGPDFKTAYVLCDEECLPTSKETIRAHTKAELGVDLLWKSDFLPASTLGSNLVSSMLDFEVALKMPAFAGNSRSTFCGFVAFEIFCRTGARPQNQFIYNLAGPRLGHRQDTGPLMAPHEATDSLNAHTPFMPTQAHDIRWPFSLTAHVATLGDITLTPDPAVPLQHGTLCLDTSANTLRAFEGLQFDGNPFLPDLEYRVQNHTGHQTEWAPLGTFCGSRGQGLPLTGFAIRLKGPAALTTTCLYAGRFMGAPAPVTAQNGQWCRTTPPQNLLGLHLVFKPT